MHNSFFKKGFLKNLFTSLVISLGIFIVLSAIMGTLFINSIEESSLTSCNIINNYFNPSNDTYKAIYELHNYYLGDIPNTIKRIVIFNENNILVYDSAIEGDFIPNEALDNDLVNTILSGNSICSKQWNNFLSDELSLVTGIPLEKKSTIVGGVIINVSLKKVMSYLLIKYGVAFISIFLVIFLLVYAMIYFQRKASYSLEIINDVSKEIADGNLSSRIRIRSVSSGFKELGRNMNYMASELEKMEDMRRNFIANVSHDFRTPLTSIKGFVQAMQDGTIPVEKQKKYLGIVLDEANRLTKLTNSILLLSKMESNSIVLEKNNFDIHHVIRKVLLQFENQIKDKNLLISLRLEGHELFVYADLNQIQRVLYNLIDNAIKFCDSHNSIAIDTHVVKSKAKISILDTGRGIEKENLKYIWSRFNKIDRSRGEDKKGVGIGLSIVREILKAHNETITVSSKKNVETCFTFTLALSKDHYPQI